MGFLCFQGSTKMFPNFQAVASCFLWNPPLLTIEIKPLSIKSVKLHFQNMYATIRQSNKCPLPFRNGANSYHSDVFLFIILRRLKNFQQCDTLLHPSLTEIMSLTSPTTFLFIYSSTTISYFLPYSLQRVVPPVPLCRASCYLT